MQKNVKKTSLLYAFMRIKQKIKEDKGINPIVKEHYMLNHDHIMNLLHNNMPITDDNIGIIQAMCYRYYYVAWELQSEVGTGPSYALSYFGMVIEWSTGSLKNKAKEENDEFIDQLFNLNK